MSKQWTRVKFGQLLKPNKRPYLLAPDEDANLVGMRLYGHGPFHRELKPAMRIAKKSHFVTKTGDVIYNKLFAWKGAFGVVPEHLHGMFVSDKFPTYELDRSQVSQDWVRWYFRCPALWEEARTMSTGSAALSKLTLNPPKFLLLTIPLPTLDEQRRIVDYLDLLSAKITKASTLRKGAMESAEVLMRGRLNQLVSSIPPNGVLADVLTSKPRNGWSARCDNADNGTPVLSLSAVTGFEYRSSEFKRTSLPVAADAHYWLSKGDVLITRSNTPELVGHVAVYDGTPHPCIYPDLVMRLEFRTELVLTRFAWYWLQSEPARAFIKEKAKGTSPTMKKISQSTVMAVPFPTQLTIDEQTPIVAELDALQPRVRALKGSQVESAAELDALLPAALDRAFKGEL